jgi:hypothetical protein
MIGFTGTSITVTLNYNHLLQLTIGDGLRLVQFLPGLRASSLPLWLTCTNDVCLKNPSADDYRTTESRWILVDECFYLQISLQNALSWLSLSLSYITTDGQSASLSWYQTPFWGLWPDFLILSDTYWFVDMGRPLWRVDGSVFYNWCCLRQRSHSQVRVPRGSWPPFTVSDLRLPQPGGPGLCIYIPQEQGGPVIHPGTGLLFDPCLLVWLPFIASGEPDRNHCLQKFHYCCSSTVYSALPRECVFTAATCVRKPLPRNGHPLQLHHSGFQADTLVMETCLAKRCPTVDHSGFQVSCHNTINRPNHRTVVKLLWLRLQIHAVSPLEHIYIYIRIIGQVTMTTEWYGSSNIPLHQAHTQTQRSVEHFKRLVTERMNYSLATANHYHHHDNIKTVANLLQIAWHRTGD